MTFRYTQLLATITLGIMALFIVTGCGSSGITIREGKERQSEDADNSMRKESAIIVHVDTSDRIVTIRKGFGLGEKFLIAINSRGKESAVLKGRERSVSEGLQTADILEGSPSINDVVVPASKERSAALANIYLEPEAE